MALEEIRLLQGRLIQVLDQYASGFQSWLDKDYKTFRRISTPIGSIRVRCNRDMSPRALEQAAYDASILFEAKTQALLSHDAPLIKQLSDLSAVYSPDDPEVCYFSTRLFGLGFGLGDSTRHKAIEAPDLFRQLRAAELLCRRLSFKRDILRNLFQAVVAAELENPKIAYDNRRDRGLVCVNRREYIILSELTDSGHWWLIQWPQTTTCYFTLKLY